MTRLDYSLFSHWMKARLLEKLGYVSFVWASLLLFDIVLSMTVETMPPLHKRSWAGRVKECMCPSSIAPLLPRSVLNLPIKGVTRVKGHPGVRCEWRRWGVGGGVHVPPPLSWHTDLFVINKRNKLHHPFVGRGQAQNRAHRETPLWLMRQRTCGYCNHWDLFALNTANVGETTLTHTGSLAHFW